MGGIRQMGFVLLIAGTVEHGLAHADFTGAAPNTFGLTRVERDLQRRAERADARRQSKSGGS